MLEIWVNRGWPLTSEIQAQLTRRFVVQMEPPGGIRAPRDRARRQELPRPRELSRTDVDSIDLVDRAPYCTTDRSHSNILLRGGFPGTAFKMQACQPTAFALRAARTSRSTTIQRRNLQDIAITRTGKPIIRSQGGRSSLGGHTVTVFGATGFLGRYIVHRLARKGNQVVVPFRDDMGKRHLKVTGDLGRVTFMEFDLRNTQSIEESVRHSDIVINLVGKNYPTKNFSLFDVNVESVERIAEACSKYDVDRFIHLSSYNADANSPSEFFRAKVRWNWSLPSGSKLNGKQAEGERVARTLFPETTIVRPAPCFGFEDNLLHRLAGVTNFLTVNNMQERFWPVHVSRRGVRQ